MKSTFMLNWAYNQAVIYQHNCLLFSLETPYNQCRRILYAMHSMHEKFKAIRYQLGIQKNPNMSVGLDYQKIRDGVLSPPEKEFLFKHVVKDFNNPANEYGKIHIEVGDPVELVLDVAPGRVFKGVVRTIGFGVSEGFSGRTGGLETVSESTGWLRDPQRFPVIISFANDEAAEFLRAGGQANVIVYTGRRPILNAIGKLRIRLVSWLSFVR